jgi:RHS repeat-associated protein
VEFLWDGDELAADIDSLRGTRVFVHEPGTFVPMLQAEQGEVFAVVNDHLGMPKELVDGDGRIAWSAAHSAWGMVVEEYRDTSTQRQRSVESPFRLLGQYNDDETGLCYTRFRYFDAEIGRWCSPDPLGIPGGMNLYRFDESPTVAVDPLGLKCKVHPPQPDWFTKGVHIEASNGVEVLLKGVNKELVLDVFGKPSKRATSEALREVSKFLRTDEAISEIRWAAEQGIKHFAENPVLVERIKSVLDCI